MWETPNRCSPGWDGQTLRNNTDRTPERIESQSHHLLFKTDLTPAGNGNRRTKTCLKVKVKCHEEKEAKWPTLFSFFSWQQPVPVPSSITPSTSLQGGTLASTAADIPTVPLSITPSTSLQGGTLASMAADIPTVSTEKNSIAQDTKAHPTFLWRYPHEIGYAKPARHLARVQLRTSKVN